MITATGEEPRLPVGGATTDASSRFFVAALGLASIVHLVLFLSLGFAFPRVSPAKRAPPLLEVIVLRQTEATIERPETADAVAQVDHKGGGAAAQEAEREPVMASVADIPAPDFDLASHELPGSEIPVPPLPAEPGFPEPLVEQAPPAVSELASREWLAEHETLAQPEPEPVPGPMAVPEPSRLERPSARTTAAQILASRNLEIAALTARIQRSSAAYANRPRRKAVSASTHEYKYANYLDAWRRKVERVGNLNYPEEARRHKMYGNLILHVAVRGDGSIERVRVLRSSGFELLDEAAVKIVELSAPFAPLPPDIKAEADILDITRTWQFLSNNRLGWEN